MSSVGKTPIGLEFIRILFTPKNIQEVIAEIIFQDIDILSHPSAYICACVRVCLFVVMVVCSFLYKMTKGSSISRSQARHRRKTSARVNPRHPAKV